MKDLNKDAKKNFDRVVEIISTNEKCLTTRDLEDDDLVYLDSGETVRVEDLDEDFCGCIEDVTRPNYFDIYALSEKVESSLNKECSFLSSSEKDFLIKLQEIISRNMYASGGEDLEGNDFQIEELYENHILFNPPTNKELNEGVLKF